MTNKRILELRLIHWAETDKAILVTNENDDEDNAVWLPKSQIESYYEDSLFIVLCPEWLALDKGLIS